MRLDGKAQRGPGGSHPRGRTIEKANEGGTHHEKGADIRSDAEHCADALTACGQPKAEEPGAPDPAASAAVQTASPEESTEPTTTPEPSEETPTAPAETDAQPAESTTTEPPAEQTAEAPNETETTQPTEETEPTAETETTPVPVQKPAEDKPTDNSGDIATQMPEQPTQPGGGTEPTTTKPSGGSFSSGGVWIPDDYEDPIDPVRSDPNSQTSGENTWEHVQEAWEGIS